MEDVFAWIISFVISIALFGIVVYQMMCLADLEFDYINQYDVASRINGTVLPEFVVQGVLGFLHLISGHWVVFLLCAPYTYYNFKMYTQGRHLVDVTEIFNQLSWEKKVRMYKIGYLAILMSLTVFLMLWSLVDESTI